jgi:glycosyltransferase involved in cell wall biosynthesis
MLKKVFVDCERMKYPHTGLYHFCLQLGKAILKQAAACDEEVMFYLPKWEGEAFGKEANYMSQHFMHKHVFPKICDGAIWHCTFQGSNYIPVNKKVRVILTIHDLNFLYDSKQDEKCRKRLLSRLQCKIDRADHIVAISDFVLNDLKRNLQLKSKPSCVIYNGCNIDDSLPVYPPENIPDKPFLFTIGGIGEKKNFHVLPALLQHNDLYLIIAGREESKEYLQLIKNEAQRYGAADRLIFAGTISENDKIWFLSHCHAFVFPSTAEGFGLPVLEAMYFGKPVILSACTSLPEIGGDCAYYFENFEPESMQNTFKRSMEHFEKTKPFLKIRERALSFSWQKAAEQYWQLYRNLLDANSNL